MVAILVAGLVLMLVFATTPLVTDVPVFPSVLGESPAVIQFEMTPTDQYGAPHP
ncbi:hypothetical protein RF644_14850 [Kocuria sp. CPCC 205258]